MTPTKITLEVTSTHIQLKVTATGTQKGYVVIESTKLAGDKPKDGTILQMRKHGAKYAKRFNILFVDQTA